MKIRMLSAVMAIIMLLAVFSIAWAEDYSEPELFLEKMAEGITDRLAVSGKDENSMTKEEKAAYYLDLVNLELDKIEEFSEQTFADANFDELAHMYINACRMQQCAAKNHKNENLYISLWDGGRQARSVIIVEMYERYDLNLTSEQIANYR